MWNDLDTGLYEGMIAETVNFAGKDGENVRAYWSRPLGAGPHPGLVLIPHMPGWDEFCREASRRFTQHGYSVLCPDIYRKSGTGKPAEVAANVRDNGGVPDSEVMADTASCLSFLKSQDDSNGKCGVIGMCSGGRHTFLAACTVEGFDAAVDCWGGAFGSPMNANAPIDHVDGLNIPLLGIFGNEDFWPSKDEVDRMEAVLKEKGKDYTFYRYDGAGHGIWYYDKPMYRQEQAMDSWNKAIAFLDDHLKG